MAEVRADIGVEIPLGEVSPSLIDNLIGLLRGRTTVLCIGTSTGSVAQILARGNVRKVTLLVDHDDFYGKDSVPNVKVISDKLTSIDISSRFSGDEFDAVILGAAPSTESPSYEKIGQAISHFKQALVLSLPNLIEGDKALLRKYEEEIERLKKLLKVRDESLAWYSKRLREHLTNHYRLEKTHYQRLEEEAKHQAVQEQLLEVSKNLAEKDKQYRLLLEDRDRIKESLDTSMRYSPEGLPGIFRYPFKALIALCKYGPLEPLRAIKKKRARTKNVSELPEYPAIDIITLGYDSERFIDGYFQAFRKVNYPHDRITLHILDNHPEHASFRKISRDILSDTQYPIKVNLTKSERNLGFAGGNNVLMRRFLNESKAPLVFLLNIDTQIGPDCLSHLVHAMRTDKSAGMVEALQEPREHPKYYDPKNGETHWCSGGGVMIRREALEEVGLFDERFFLYCEDVDLSWRMWLHGWRCKLEPSARYLHHTELDDKGKDLSNQHYFSIRNCYYMHFKYGSRSSLAALERHFAEQLAAQTDAKHIETLKRARSDALANKHKFFWDRISAAFLPPERRWMIFDGFHFEHRRPYIEEADRRVILAS